MTKATMLISVGLAAGFAMADGMSIADARKQVADCVSNPSTMTAVVKQLPAADQCTYLGDVVAAVAKLPGSQQDKAAAYVNVCRSALKGATKENIDDMIAEVFATVPPEYLPAISESLASDMLNRATDPSKTYTDADYLEIAKSTMNTVNKRLDGVDASDVRSAFAALTFIRGSNTASDDLVKAMVGTLPDSAQKPASEEWFPSALAEGDKRSYDAMLVAASADDNISPEVLTTVLLRVPGPAADVVLLSDLNEANTDPTTKSSEKMPVFDATSNPMNDTLATGLGGTGGAADSVDVASRAVAEETEKNMQPIPVPEPPGPYQNQTTY